MIREQIHNTDEFKQISSQQQDKSKQDQRTGKEADTVGEALAPVLDAEKGDVLFWTQVLQLLVLIAIYRELQRGA